MKYLSTNECIPISIKVLTKANVNFTPRDRHSAIDYLDYLVSEISWRTENRIFLRCNEEDRYEMALLAVSAIYNINKGVGSDSIYCDSPTIQLIYNKYIPEEVKLEYLLEETGVYNYDYMDDIIDDIKYYNKHGKLEEDFI